MMYNSLRPSFFDVYVHNILQAFGSCADWVLRADKYGPTYVQFPLFPLEQKLFSLVNLSLDSLDISHHKFFYNGDTGLAWLLSVHSMPH